MLDFPFKKERKQDCNHLKSYTNIGLVLKSWSATEPHLNKHNNSVWSQMVNVV